MAKRVQARRAGRRRAERALRRRSRPPAKVAHQKAEGPAATLAARAYRLAQTFAGEGRSVEAALALTRHVLDLADQEVDAVRQTAPPAREIACTKGCAWCCFLQVAVSAPEALLVAHYLRATLSPTELDALRERVGRLDDRIHGADARQRLAARLPCALLAGSACSVYPVRPLACRGWNSYDARVCRRAVEHGSEPTALLYAPQAAVTDGLLAGLIDGLAAGGLIDGLAAGAEARAGAPALTSDRLELTAALRIALEVPDAAERWLAGEPVFAPAALTAAPSRDRGAGPVPQRGQVGADPCVRPATVGRTHGSAPTARSPSAAPDEKALSRTSGVAEHRRT